MIDLRRRFFLFGAAASVVVTPKPSFFFIRRSPLLLGPYDYVHTTNSYSLLAEALADGFLQVAWSDLPPLSQEEQAAEAARMKALIDRIRV